MSGKQGNEIHPFNYPFFSLFYFFLNKNFLFFHLSFSGGSWRNIILMICVRNWHIETLNIESMSFEYNGPPPTGPVGQPSGGPVLDAGEGLDFSSPRQKRAESVIPFLPPRWSFAEQVTHSSHADPCICLGLVLPRKRNRNVPTPLDGVR